MRVRLGKVCLTPRGTYSAGATYARLDLVSYEGSTYVSLVDGNTDHATTDTSYWMKLVSGDYILTYIQSHGLHTSSLSVAGNVLVGGGLTTNGDVSVGGNLSVDDNLTVGGSIINQELEATIDEINDRIDILAENISGGSSSEADVANGLSQEIWDIIASWDTAAVQRAIDQMSGMFVKKSAWNTMFDLKSSSNDSLDVNGNLSSLQTILAKYNVASTGGVSALGIGSGGGGGGGGGAPLSAPLDAINGIGNPSETGLFALTYNSSTGDYTWSAITGDGQGGIGSVTLAAANGSKLTVNGGSTATGSTFTLGVSGVIPSANDVNFWNGAIVGASAVSGSGLSVAVNANQLTVGLASGKYLPTTADKTKWDGYGNNFDSQGRALTAISANSASMAERLSGSATYNAWGRTYWQNGVPQSVSGDLDNVGHVSMDNNAAIRFKCASDQQYRSAFTLNSSDVLALGWGQLTRSTDGSNASTFKTVVNGGAVEIAVGYTSGGTTVSNTAFKVENTGRCYVTNGERGLRIGDALLKWDNTHKALAVEYCGTGSYQASFYAEGGVSALGFSSSEGGGGGGGGTGTVTSVALSMPSGFRVGVNDGSSTSYDTNTITGRGEFVVGFAGSITRNYVLAAPSNTAGAPSWRALVVGDIPELSADKITSGTLADARIPSLSADKITSGTFADARIPSLSASKITSGTFAVARIPSLSADKITSGTFAVARIPSLSADKITSGTFDVARIPALPYVSSVSGTFWGRSFSNGSTVDGTIDNATCLEFKKIGDNAGHGGFVDFHFNGSSADYTSRIIESASGQVQVVADLYLGSNKKLQIGNGTVQWSDGMIKFGSLNVTNVSPATNVGGLKDVLIDNNGVIRFFDNPQYPDSQSQESSKTLSIITVNSRNEFALGYGIMTSSSDEVRRLTRFQGGRFEMQVGYRENGTDYVTTAFKIGKEATINGNLVDGIVNVTQGLRIGDGLLTWDSINNALKVTRHDGTTANLYTTGGVSALGFQSGGISSLDAFTINTLTTSSIANGSGNVKMGNICSNTPASGTPNWKILTTGAATFTDVTVSGQGGTVSSYVVSANDVNANNVTADTKVQSAKFYFDNTRYLHVSNGKLMYNNGSTDKEVSFVS